MDQVTSVGGLLPWEPEGLRERPTAMAIRLSSVSAALVTALLGYFPARRLGWHEDLPAAAAYEWAFRPARLEDAYRRLRGSGLDPLRHFGEMRGEILAIGLSDDPFGTLQAIDRLLGYYTAAARTRIEVRPESLRVEGIGHFAWFNDRFESTLWMDALRWLRDGVLPDHAAGKAAWHPADPIHAFRECD